MKRMPMLVVIASHLLEVAIAMADGSYYHEERPSDFLEPMNEAVDHWE